MRPLSNALSRILDVLTDGLEDPTSSEGTSSRKYDNGGPGIMAAHVERIGANRYSVAHYFIQNGDSVPDPDMEFLKVDGAWYPAACSMYPNKYTRAIIDENGTPLRYSPRAYADLREFSKTFLRNVKSQQGIKVPKKATVSSEPAKVSEAELPTGKFIGTLTIRGLVYDVEKCASTEAPKKVAGDRPLYVLRGRKGAVYITMRNQRNPNHMFLVNGRSFGIALNGVWLTDEEDVLRVRSQ